MPSKDESCSSSLYLFKSKYVFTYVGVPARAGQVHQSCMPCPAALMKSVMEISLIALCPHRVSFWHKGSGRVPGRASSMSLRNAPSSQQATSSSGPPHLLQQMGFLFFVIVSFCLTFKNCVNVKRPKNMLLLHFSNCHHQRFYEKCVYIYIIFLTTNIRRTRIPTKEKNMLVATLFLKVAPCHNMCS